MFLVLLFLIPWLVANGNEAESNDILFKGIPMVS